MADLQGMKNKQWDAIFWKAKRWLVLYYVQYKFILIVLCVIVGLLDRPAPRGRKQTEASGCLRCNCRSARGFMRYIFFPTRSKAHSLGTVPNTSG